VLSHWRTPFALITALGDGCNEKIAKVGLFFPWSVMYIITFGRVELNLGHAYPGLTAWAILFRPFRGWCVLKSFRFLFPYSYRKASSGLILIARRAGK
jgi:hypothetical protein